MKNTQKAKQFSNRKFKNNKSKKRTVGGVGEQPPEPIMSDVCTKKVASKVPGDNCGSTVDAAPRLFHKQINT